MKKVTVAAAVASTTGVTLYLADGEVMELSSANWNTEEILRQITPVLANRQTYDLDLEKPLPERIVEKKSGGVITFIKRKVSMFGKFFAQAKSEMDVRDGVPNGVKIGVTIGVMPKVAALNADPFERAPDETIVAVIDGKMVPGMENIQSQIIHAAGTDTKGLEEFLRRISKIEGKRKHSVQELLNFLKRADLPFADDGSIIAYKVLKTYGEGSDKFVDCHSGRVKQKLGSHVSMAESLVDLNRRTECSVGLHVARRGYLNGFSGDVITLIKIAPEDVIAVPFGEPDKMRVCGYHIIATLPASVHRLLRSNKPMTSDPEAAKILANAIKGIHAPIVEYVRIGSEKGGDVTVHPAAGFEPEVAVEVKMESIAAVAVGEIGATSSPAPDPVKIAREVEQIRKETPVETPIETAAITGDLSAALSAPEPAVESKTKTKRPAAAPAKMVPPVAPLTAPETDKRDAEIMKLFAEGKTKRDIERLTGVPRTTVRRIIAKNS